MSIRSKLIMQAPAFKTGDIPATLLHFVSRSSHISGHGVEEPILYYILPLNGYYKYALTSAGDIQSADAIQGIRSSMLHIPGTLVKATFTVTNTDELGENGNAIGIWLVKYSPNDDDIILLGNRDMENPYYIPYYDNRVEIVDSTNIPIMKGDSIFAFIQVIGNNENLDMQMEVLYGTNLDGYTNIPYDPTINEPPGLKLSNTKIIEKLSLFKITSNGSWNKNL